MKRNEIEAYMKAHDWHNVALVYHESDALGIYCELKGGFLCDYTGHRVDRNLDVYGFVAYDHGEPIHIAWTEVPA